MIGTGAISHKHAQAYANIGYRITVCTDVFPEAGKKFAEQYGCEFVPTYEEVCSHPDVDYVDVCTFPNFRLQPIEVAAMVTYVCSPRSAATNGAALRVEGGVVRTLI